ncbi:cilia- and flagella- associated protein 210 [Meriones unguiculatus]|uniref:cilia- and flagella- associated protein 210 n=1 Tax=Meriones unguiculatus TaxID=10047 RepID=UPI000B4FCA7B|nr:cilia- and flagella- associated protein 210 [Meriones unguiculatus]
MQARFGRRSGLSKESTGMKDCEKDDVPYPPLLPRKVNLQEVTIIPHNEWERIRGSLDKLTREAAALRAERTAKRRMHTQSQNLVKHWTNTYAGMKEQKLKAKQKRGEELEAERQILDVEEELHKEGERKKAIESAKQYQFYQTERVKSFHSGLLLSRVMKERDAQIQYKKNTEKSDKKWEEQLKLSSEKAIKEEKEKEEKQRQARLALAKDHLKQIKEREEEEKERKKNEEKDSEEIKRQNLLYEIEVKKKLSKKQKEIDENKKQFFDSIHDKNIIRAIEQQQEEEEDERTMKFIKAKKRLMQMRQDKEAEIQRLMEERKERINNFLTELMQQKLDNEDFIIARDVAEAEAEREKAEKEKNEKTQAELKAISEHRATVMKNKEEEERQRKIESKEQLLALLEADKLFQELEKEKKLKASIKQQEIQDAHVQKMAVNKFNARQLKEEDLEYWRLTEALAAEKEEEFQKYAREVIACESESTKKYTYPLVRAVQEGVGGGHGPPFVGRGGIRPSYQATDATGIQLPFYNSQGSKFDFQKSKRRLGFTW